VRLVRRLKTGLQKEPINPADLSFGNAGWNTQESTRRIGSISNRLQKNVQNLNQSTKIIAVSDDVKEILATYGVDPGKIVVQHIGSTIAENRISHHKKIDPKNIVFGFIGGVGYYKGVHQLAEAFLALPGELQMRSTIEIWGKGNQNYIAGILKLFAGNENASNRILFKGPYRPADIAHITNRVDVAVLPSLCADTAPQTIFESFSAGLPIIAPRIGGFPDFVTDKVNGLLYAAAEIDSLSACMQEIITVPS